MTSRLKPRAGSLPLPKDEVESTERVKPWWVTARESGYTLTLEELAPFKEAFARDLERRGREDNFSALQKARAKAEELIGTLRTDAFDDWIRRCVVDAGRPDEWTQASALYENYLAHASRFGRTREQRKSSQLAQATQTQWGRMMATLYVKKRRTAGWYYPLRCKQAKGAVSADSDEGQG